MCFSEDDIYFVCFFLVMNVTFVIISVIFTIIGNLFMVIILSVIKAISVAFKGHVFGRW